MPDDADDASVKAEFKDGMLNVTLNKTVKAKTKAISVAVS
jgi:HSP20 family molecular chaperone IbpA